jgi:hypothetical protein
MLKPLYINKMYLWKYNYFSWKNGEKGDIG